ncbi:UvrD-helicase domain-containing protein [Trichlorobacter lovleyi]|uniref:UvrD-helicase domain-containing protein n=1 Tax=Trichlorobacter lovleyi TaxID=313985 RepID=UPI00223F5995|nr:UvrD-helicase domain-containing protein [Trichlorobacter lovleyi]QOX79000.1 UvrD-helicase domain-containing protein [Trichlorobacter lovleyi]
MNYIADLHIHSPFSRATSPDSSPAGLAAWARLKGIQVIGTGDCTHPGWFKRLKEQLEPAEPGFYRLKDEKSIPDILPGVMQSDSPIRFLLSAEISSIYKRGGATRKIHNLLYLPDFASVERLNAKLAGIGNIASDGRPILGLDSRDLLEIMLECSPDAFLVPAHIWTPWFSLFGSKSGFDSIEECFGDLSSHIFALETGLSSDPDMNRLISGLDHCALISNSDCHSPSKLGREANLFNTGLDFFSLRDALKKNQRDSFCGTVEFFPEEGKYHFDGHRDCKVCLDPHETRRLQNLCPACGKPVTVGVHHRVLELADRAEPQYRDDAPVFYSLIPLPELLGELLQVGPSSKQVIHQYGRALAQFGSEFNLLLHAELEQIRSFEPLLAEAVKRMREGTVIRHPGYDGEFGVIRVFEQGELAQLAGQGGLFGEQRVPRSRKKPLSDPLPKQLASPPATDNQRVPAKATGPNPEQQAAIQNDGRRVLVAAGPGTGKTFTLVSRLQRLLDQGADPSRIVAITFTTRTAEEMRERLAKSCGATAEDLFIGTFHRFCLEQLRQDNPGLTVVGPESRQRLLKRLYAERGVAERSRISNAISAHCSGIQVALTEETKLYVDELVRLNALDLDAIIPVCVQLMNADESFKQRVQQAVQHLFVDEFQDLNRSQYDLVQLLAEQATVFAIGDPDQAIYGFRGGDLRYFFRFAEVPDTVLLPLKTTYRLPRRIVQAAGSLICRNLICSGLPLSAADNCPEGAIEFHRALSPGAEAELIVRRIEELIGGVDSFSRSTGRSGNTPLPDNLSFADFAILFRLGRQAEELAEALTRRGIPYQLVGATPFYMESKLRPLYQLLQAASGSDEIALWLSLFGALKGVGTTTLDRLESELPLRGDFFDLAAEHDHTPATGKALKLLASTLDRLQKSAADQGVAAALRISLPVFGLEPDDVTDRLLQMAEGFGTDLSAFSHHLKQYASATVYDPRAEAVALMSCHSSKGLEFPVIFMTGLEEGIFPCTLMGTPNVEEERRLFYVGLTRAKQRVILTASGYRGWMGQGLRELSRFITELPAELVDKPEAGRQRRRAPVESEAQMELF